MQAVILAGGLSRRLGGVPKAGLVLDGQTLLARTVDSAAQLLQMQQSPAAAPALGGTGARIAVVGPVKQVQHWLESSRSQHLVTVIQEDPPYSGPAAGIAAGLSALQDRGEQVLVLACDMPHVAQLLTILSRELAAAPDTTGVMASDAGRAQPLAAIYPEQALRAAADKARETHRLQNASVISLLASVISKDCAVPPGLTADIDTWEDARAQGIAMRPAPAEG